MGGGWWMDGGFTEGAFPPRTLWFFFPFWDFYGIFFLGFSWGFLMGFGGDGDGGEGLGCLLPPKTKPGGDFKVFFISFAYLVR